MAHLILLFTLCGSPYYVEAWNFDTGEHVGFLWEKRYEMPTESAHFATEILSDPEAGKYEISIEGPDSHCA